MGKRVKAAGVWARVTVSDATGQVLLDHGGELEAPYVKGAARWVRSHTSRDRLMFYYWFTPEVPTVRFQRGATYTVTLEVRSEQSMEEVGLMHVRFRHWGTK